MASPPANRKGVQLYNGVERGGNRDKLEKERGDWGRGYPFPFCPLLPLPLTGIFCPCLTGYWVRAIQLHRTQQSCCHRKPWFGPTFPSKRHREIFRCLQLAGNDASITAHVECNTKLELSLIKSSAKRPSSWSYHRKQKALPSFYFIPACTWLKS